MNTLKMPGFTAASALYRTSGHYQTSRQAINSPTQMISAIHPAAETIEVFGCPPGSTMVGTPPDDWYCFSDPLTEPSWGGGGGGTPFEGGGGRGSGGTGRPPKEKPPREKPPKGTFGDGPDRRQIPDSFTCKGTSIDIETCHSCFDTEKYGQLCSCYDCDRGSGKCAPGYDCTDIYGR